VGKQFLLAMGATPTHPDMVDLEKQKAALEKKLAAVNAREAAGDLGGKEEEAGKQRIIDQIVDTLTSTVAPETWRNNGGQMGAIRELNGQLIINQTKENQRFVYQLLQQLRETRAIQIAIEARVFLLDEDTFGKLQLPAEKDGKGIRNMVADKDLAAFLKRVQQASTKDIANPRVTLFNGQAGYIAMTHQENYIAGCRAVPDGNGKMKAEREIRTFTTGSVLNVEGTVSADRASVVLKVRPSFRQLEKMESYPAPNAPAGPEYMIQRPVFRDAEMTTMATVPAGETLVLSGLTVPGPAEKVAEAGKAGDQHVLILIRPQTIIQPNVERMPDKN
jgi:type II secretory pathway component GspD/PulD (secretin)